MIRTTYKCCDCSTLFDAAYADDQICPYCHSVNVVQAELNSSIEKPIIDEPDEPKNYIIYYYKFGFKVMHKDSHFYKHTDGNLSELLKPNSGVRFYTREGAIKAIETMKKNSPDWDLRAKKVK